MRRRRIDAALDFVHSAGAILALVAAFAVVAPAALAASSPWQENEQSRVRLVTPWEVAPVGDSLTLGLEFTTRPGWHVYWKNSGDAGYPPALDFADTPGATGNEILWPAPERYELPGDLVAFGYEKHVVYPVRLDLDPGALEAGGTLTLAANLDYLVCEVDCIPYSYRLEVAQPLAAPEEEPVPDPQATALVERWLDQVPRQVEEVAGLESEGVLDLAAPDQPALLVRFAGLDDRELPGTAPELFLEVSDTFDAGRPERLEAPAGEVRFRVPLTFRIRPETLPTEVSFAWTLAWTGSGGSSPDEPNEEPPDGTAVATEPAPASTEVESGGVPRSDPAEGRADAAELPRPAPLALVVEARREVPVRTDGLGFGNEPADAAAADPAGADRPGLVSLLLWAFLGGLLLHLTPGVLPLTVARLSELPAAGATAHGPLLTAAGAVAGALALLPLAAVWESAGRAAAWGAQLQEPLSVALLTLVSTLVALNLWGFLRWPLRPPVESGGGTAGGLRAVLVGLMAVLLGLAWNLPPLARSLGPALAPQSGTATALSTLLALGLGLALPFLLAAVLPATVARLAPSGADGADRRARLAEALAFVELGAVLWLLYLLSRQVASEGLAFVQLALLGVALAAWWRHAARRASARAVAVVLLLVLAITSVWLAGEYRLGSGGSAALPAAERTETGADPA